MKKGFSPTSQVDIFFHLEATPPIMTIRDKSCGWLFRLTLNQKPTFNRRGKNRTACFLVDRVIETKKGLRLKSKFWTGVLFIVKVSDWDKGIRKFLREEESKGWLISIHGRKSCKEIKQEARKWFLGIPKKELRS